MYTLNESALVCRRLEVNLQGRKGRILKVKNIQGRALGTLFAKILSAGEPIKRQVSLA